MVNSLPASSAGPVRLSPLSIFATNLAGCTVVAILLWAFVPVIGRYGFLSVFVHSQLIGNAICLVWMASQSLLDRFGVRSFRLELALLPPVIAVGYVAGTVIARTVLDVPGPKFDFTGHRPQLAASLTTAVVVTLIAIGFFTAREKLINLELAAAEEARQAEAARRQAGEAQLAMLRAQIEPHMLFNTLANLRTLIAQDPERARDMLDRLVLLLRGTLAGSRATHSTLAQEFEMLETYLALMQVRLGVRLTYKLDLPAELESRIVPALLLQPVVENAIRHGIEPSTQGGGVVVTAGRRSGSLVLCVRDTGVGCAPSATTAFAEADYPIGASGLGLSNLRERLKTLYGANGRVEIQSPPPGHDAEPVSSCSQSPSAGTMVTVYLPWSGGQ